MTAKSNLQNISLKTPQGIALQQAAKPEMFLNTTIGAIHQKNKHRSALKQ
jgi:hypothetical protein